MMADAVTKPKVPLEWKRTGMESSSDESDAYVPGVNQTGNMRPKLRARHPRETKARIPSTQPIVEDLPSASSLSVQDLSQSLDERRLRPASVRHGSVSLKDLCVEDKRRIANLIKELAKVGEEREKAREELSKERKQYEQQILQLVDQQEQILRERHEVENQLIECQNLLVKCQVQQTSVPPSTFPSSQQYLTAPVDPHDTMHSLYANVGSPATNLQRPVTAMIDRELSLHRVQQTFNSGAATGYSQQAGMASYPYHQQQRHPLDAGDSLPQQPQHQSAKDFFANALLASQPLDFLSPWRRQQLQKNHNLPVTSQGSKEDIINRFFASQTPEKDTALTSPQRRQKGQADKQKSSKRSVFRPPIMSSTQKSADIVDYLSVNSVSTSQQDYAPLVTDDSPRSTPRNAVGDDERDSNESSDEYDGNDDGGDVRGGQTRVAFTEGNNHGEMIHSPHDGGDDAQRLHNYRKITQMERKRQLLHQRAQLLEEQKRLKQVLCEQEAMLREKQQALSKRFHHRHDHEEDLQAGGHVTDDDPLGLIPQRLAIDAALERQRAIVDSLESQNSHDSPRSMTAANNADFGRNHSTKAVSKEDNRVTASRERVISPRARSSGEKGGGGGNTFTLHSNKLSDLARKLEYSQTSDTEVSPEAEAEDESTGTDQADEEDDGSHEGLPSGRIDVGTSVSYRNIPRSAGSSPTSDSNGRRSNGHVFSRTHPLPARKLQAPGEKTMSVLEIINSLADQSPPRFHPRQEPAAFKLSSRHSPRFSPLLPESSALAPELSPFVLYHRTSSRWRDDVDNENDQEMVIIDDVAGDADEEEIVSETDDDVDLYDDGGDDNCPDLEESQILEDIFFLK